MAALSAVTITGVGLVAPGLVGWAASLPVLRGTCGHRNTPLPQLKPALLPAGERRRATPLARLVLAAAEDAMAHHPGHRSSTACVFASSGGDLDIVDRICESLKLVDRPVSPTHFHNSVHNAPAGYWAIAAGCHDPSVSLSAYDNTFSAGLIEAVSIAHIEGATVLFVAYDQAGPPPFQDHRAITEPFAVALVLAPDRAQRCLARLRLVHAPVRESTPPLTDPGLDRLRHVNPAAQSLPLLIAVASGESGLIHLSRDIGIDVHADAIQEEAR